MKRAILALSIIFLMAGGGERLRPPIPDAIATPSPGKWAPPQPSDKELNKIIRDASKEFGVPFNLIDAVILQESEYQNYAIKWERRTLAQTASPFGAASIGLMQVMGWHVGQPPCEFLTKPLELFEPVNNIRCGTAILADAIKRRGVRAGLMEYNGGDWCVDTNCRWGRNYAVRVMRSRDRYDTRLPDAPELAP